MKTLMESEVIGYNWLSMLKVLDYNKHVWVIFEPKLEII